MRFVAGLLKVTLAVAVAVEKVELQNRGKFSRDFSFRGYAVVVSVMVVTK